MKCRVIFAESSDQLEKRTNEVLRGIGIGKIVSVTQSQSLSDGDMFVTIYLTIIYND